MTPDIVFLPTIKRPAAKTLAVLEMP